MARPFSYPEVQRLEQGETCDVTAPVAEVRRKVSLYGKRARKKFYVSESSEGGCSTEVPPRARVERLRDDPAPLMG